MSEKPLHRGRGWGGSPTAMSVTPPHRGGGSEGVFFNSNETLDMCDVHVSENGKMVISTKSYHSDALERLGRLTKKLAGSLAQTDEGFTFTPYQKGSGRSPYETQVVVGSTTLKTTKDKVYISFTVPRHLTKPLMTLYIQSEMDEVKRRLEEDLYEKLKVEN